MSVSLYVYVNGGQMTIRGLYISKHIYEAIYHVNKIVQFY
jgi:hypothetical protein